MFFLLLLSPRERAKGFFYLSRRTTGKRDMAGGGGGGRGYRNFKMTAVLESESLLFSLKGKSWLVGSSEI